MYFLYLILYEDESIYTGITNIPDRRFSDLKINEIWHRRASLLGMAVFSLHPNTNLLNAVIRAKLFFKEVFDGITTVHAEGIRWAACHIGSGFLCGALAGNPTTRQIVYDREYGEVTTQLVKEFQTLNQLEADGNWGPATRGCASRTHGLNFEAAARSIWGTSTFVQPDGSQIHWPEHTGR